MSYIISVFAIVYIALMSWLAYYWACKAETYSHIIELLRQSLDQSDTEYDELRKRHQAHLRWTTEQYRRLSDIAARMQENARPLNNDDLYTLTSTYADRMSAPRPADTGHTTIDENRRAEQ